MGYFIATVGLFLFVYCLIWLLIRLIKRKPKKQPALGLLVCFVLIVVGLVLTPSPSDIEKELPQDNRDNLRTNEQTPNQNIDLSGNSIEEKPVDAETTLNEFEGQRLLDDFFETIGTDVSRENIEDIAKNIGLYIDYRNSGTGIYTYRVALEEKIASTIYREKGSCVTVSFDGLKNDVIKEITYFDEERMIAGFWSPDTGYLLADYNYPQITFCDEISNKICSQMPVSSAKDIVDYTFDGEIGENLLETLFSTITSESTESDLLSFVNMYGLSYNSRGVGNEQVIAYCYEIGDKFGENGSYITFSANSEGLIDRVTYLYYPSYYRTGYIANFYSEENTPSGFVLLTQDGYTEYSSVEELLAQLHNP